MGAPFFFAREPERRVLGTMRRTTLVLALFLAATLAPAGCASGTQQPTDPFASVPRVSVEELSKALKENRAVVVDVRPAEAYEEEHIAGAVSIPEEEVRERARELPPGKLAVAYCA